VIIMHRFSFISVVGALCAGLAAPAADIQWTPVGPGGGGWIQAIACDPRDPDVLYLGGDVGGFYLSRDGGRSWKIQNTGLTDYFVECIAIHPQDSHILLLGTEGGLFKSTDQGTTWEWKREGFPEPARYSFSAPIGALCFDPTRPEVLYAGIGRPRWGKDGRGHIYKSEDGGETWRLITPEGTLPPQAIVGDLEVSADGRYVLAATDQGLYRSEDGGATWQPAHAGLGHTDCQEIAIAPSNPQVVYCTLRTTARDGKPWNGGVYRSEDGGRSWVRRSEGLPTRVGRADEPAPMTSNCKEIVVDPRDENTVYVGDWAWVSAGVWKSVDGGQTWSRATDHYSERKNMDYGWIRQWGPSVECLAISPAKPERLVFGTSGHVFLTDDAGATWQQRYCQQFEDGRFAGTGLEVTCLNDVVPDPFDPDRVRRGSPDPAAATDRKVSRLYFCYFDIGLLISDDGGRTFRQAVQGMKHSGNCFTVAVDPSDRNKLWAGTGEWASNQGDVCRSEDRGQTWSVVGQPETGLPNGQTRCLLVDPASPPGRRTLYVTCHGHGVFKSEDDGSSWHAMNQGLPEPAVQQPCRLLMNPQDPKHLRLALGSNPPSGSGIYETRDGGETWQRVSREAPFADLKDFQADPHDFDTLYVCQREKYDRSLDPPVLFPGGLFRSTDGGVTWERLFDFHFTHCVAISPVCSQARNEVECRLLYVGTTDHPYHDGCRALGVLKSTDGGKTWQQEVDGLTSWNISCLRLDPHDPSRLYVGTGGNGGFLGLDAAETEGRG